VALQYVQNIEDAEEISQDVFVKVHEKLGSFKRESDIKTWIYRIAINQSLDFIKAKQRHKRWSFLSALSLDNKEKPIEISHFNHPGVLMEEKESIQKIFDAINRLPDNQKTVIILMKIEQNSMTETADIMKLSYKAVDALFQRAKKNLELLLTQNEEI
jgi:RNA polymerase sigma factor (sigma-70 family)